MCNMLFDNELKENTADSHMDESFQKDLSFDLQAVEGAESISEFSEYWDDLFARAVDAPPYLSRPWASTFVQEGKMPGEPLFILAWCGNKLVALFALAVRKFLNVKIAAPIGTGDGAYLGLLLDPNYRSVVDHIGNLIISEKLFDVYYSEDLSSEDAATNDLLARLATKGYSCRRVMRSPCYWIRLGRSFDEYIKSNITKGKRRKKLRYKEKKLYESADVKVIRYAGKEVTPEVNRRTATVQLESWIKRRGGAVLGRPFYQKLLKNMVDAEMTCVWLMTIDAEDAAMVYTFVAHQQLHFYWTSFKLKFESPLSIGQMLIMQVIRDACEQGIQLFDFIHGQADYKHFWATDCHNVHRVAAGRGFPGRLVAICYYVIWQTAKIKLLKSLYRRARKILHA